MTSVLAAFNVFAFIVACYAWAILAVWLVKSYGPLVWRKLGGWPALRMALRALLVFVVLYGTGIGLLDLLAYLQRR